MACRLIGAKPLSEPMLEYCWLDPWEQTSVKSLSKFIHFHLRKCIWKCRLEKGGHFISASMCFNANRFTQYGTYEMRNYSQIKPECTGEMLKQTCWHYGDIFITDCWIFFTMTTSIAASDDNFRKMTTFQSTMTSSNGNIYRVTGPLCGEFTGHKGQWCGTLMFSLICAWTNGWVNNRDTSDLRRRRAHCDVTVMFQWTLYYQHITLMWDSFSSPGKTPSLPLRYKHGRVTSSGE